MNRQPGSLILKDPSAIEPYGFDWTPYLAELGDDVVIQTSTWSITQWPVAAEPSPTLVLSNPSVVVGGRKTQVFISVGALGLTYVVTNHIVTNSSPAVTDERSFKVLVSQR